MLAASGTLIPPDPPFPSGAPWWYWLGGRPALDFVNTRRERWRRNVECLVTPGDLVLWLVQAHLLADDARAAVPPDGWSLLREARELREAIDTGVRCAVADRPTPAAAVDVIDGWLDEAALCTRLRLALDASGSPQLGEPAHVPTPRRALGAIALDAAQILGGPGRSRIRICASDTCSARFFDRSPAGRRRWCSMTKCGNAAKARRHRARQARSVPHADDSHGAPGDHGTLPMVSVPPNQERE